MDDMKEILNQNKKTLIVIGLLFLSLLIGFAYAWLTLTLNSEKTNVIRAGSLIVELDDSMTDGINLINTVPMTDQDGLKTDKYIFTVENKGTIDTYYTIYLDDVALAYPSERMKDEFIKYKFVKNDVESDFSLLTATHQNGERVLGTSKLSPGMKDNYSLRMWIDSKTDNSVMSTVFCGKIRVVATQPSS